MRRFIQCIGLLLLVSTLSFGALQYVGISDAYGQGFGSVSTVLTVHKSADANLKGCVGVSSTTPFGDVFGDSQSGDCSGNSGVVQGGGLTQTRTFAELGFGPGTLATDIGVIYNSSQSANGGITLNNITLTIYDSVGTRLYQSIGLQNLAGANIPSLDFDPTFGGVGKAGQLFVLNPNNLPTDTLASVLSNPQSSTYRIGLSIDTGCVADTGPGCFGNDDGQETLSIANLSVANDSVPEPSTWRMMMAALAVLTVGRVSRVWAARQRS